VWSGNCLITSHAHGATPGITSYSISLRRPVLAQLFAENIQTEKNATRNCYQDSSWLTKRIVFTELVIPSDPRTTGAGSNPTGRHYYALLEHELRY